VNKVLEKKIEKLPKKPGVYFYKDKSGEIIYIGKAAVLRNRVRQYFQKSRIRDPKTDALVAEITDVDWREVDTEIDALFLEAEMIRRYMPRYNIDLRDDKSFVYVRIDINSAHPTVSFTRRPLDDGAEYLGPYTSKITVNKALRSLRRAFPYSTHSPTNIPKRACLQAQIGLCPGLEAGMTSLEDYRSNLRQLISYLKGNRKALVREVEKEMKAHSRASEFEKAAADRDKLNALRSLERQVIFGDREAVDISKDRGLVELAGLLQIEVPRMIEGFDISHMSGTDNVASMVVFVAGVPDKGEYRKFKMRKPGNDDFAHMNEAITRRLSESNVKKWGVPNLFLIDGGKGQVSSAQIAMHQAGHNIPMIGLAKRYEEIIIPKPPNDSQGEFAKNSQFDIKVLPSSSDAVKLLQRIRDESHRFAVSYHSTLKRSRQTASVLDDIPTIGPQTKRKLLKTFGSLRGVIDASEKDIEKVVGSKKSALLIKHLEPSKEATNQKK